jgi:hypothetical protein
MQRQVHHALHRDRLHQNSQLPFAPACRRSASQRPNPLSPSAALPSSTPAASPHQLLAFPPTGLHICGVCARGAHVQQQPSQSSRRSDRSYLNSADSVGRSTGANVGRHRYGNITGCARTKRSINCNHNRRPMRWKGKMHGSVRRVNRGKWEALDAMTT